MNRTQPLYENYIDLLIACFRRAQKDARKGDKSARLFLRDFGVIPSKRRRTNKQGVLNNV